MSIATPAKCPSSFVQCCFTLSCFPPEFLFSAYIIINFWPVSPSHSLQILWITVIRASFSTIFWPSSFVHVTLFLFLFTAHILFQSEPACMWDSPIFFHQSLYQFLFLRHAIELYCLHCIASAVCYFVHSTLLKVDCHEHWTLYIWREYSILVRYYCLCVVICKCEEIPDQIYLAKHYSPMGL